MKKHRPPWSVRGVSQEARAKTAKAAARRHMTIGEWVTNALITVANSELGSGPALAGSNETAASPPATMAAAGGAVQLSPETGALTEAVETLARRIEESDEREKAVTVLVERLDSIERADRAMTALANRFAELDRRDRTLLAVAERLVGNERKNEQRLAVLASAMNVLANRLELPKRRRKPGVTSDDLGRSLEPLKAAIDDLAGRINEQATPVTPVTVIQPAFQHPQTVFQHPAAHTAAHTNGGTPPKDPGKPAAPLPEFDYDELNQRAFDNTRRQEADDAEPATRRSGLMSRLFGSG